MNNKICKSLIKTKVKNINNEIKNIQNYEDKKIINNNDCFLEIVILYFIKTFN